MSQPLIISCEVSRQRALDHIAGLTVDPSLGKVWEVTVARKIKRRTPSQNGLYFRWVDEVVGYVSEYTGYEKDDVHEYFKQRFLDPVKIEIEGVVAERYTTTKLDTSQMATYTDKIFRWASGELGLVLTVPPVATEER